MSLSKHSIEALLDLVEIRLSSMQVCDREDARELTALERCRRELASLKGPRRRAAIVAQPKEEARRPRARPYLAALVPAGA